MYQDPYKVLGVSRDASDDEIKKAYRELTKKYHPDLNPGDPEAEKKMHEINAAYDQIKSGNAQPSYAQGGAQYQQTERSEYTAAKNFIRNGMYREAMNALSGVPTAERDAKWYYLSAGANMYLGNRVSALENAKRAVEMEPNNQEYRLLLQQLQSGGDFYDSYTTRSYHNGIDPGRLCCTMLALQCMCGNAGIPCFFCI